MPSASSARLLYLDSSALVKLVVAEPESTALIEFLAGWPHRVSSALARVEVLRAVRRAKGTSTIMRRATRVLARIALVRIDEIVLKQAARVTPRELRSLDAIHLATARSLDALAGVVTYDERLARAASRQRVRVFSPA